MHLPAPKPWEFQPGIDTPNSYQGFAWYLGQASPRRFRPVALALNMSLQTVTHWAADGLWKDRALAWDQHLIAQRMTELEAVYREDGAEVAKQYLDVIRLQKSIWEDQLEKLQRECLERPDTLRMKPHEIMRMGVETFKQERLIRGQATEIISDELDLSKLSDEELAAYDELTRKARKVG